MSIDAAHIGVAILVGLGATLVMDLWALVLRRAFNIASLNYCFVGRWLRHMPAGTFRHENIAAAPQKGSECTVGWTAHYIIGVVFGLLFVVRASESWLERPTPLPALLFGMVTVLIPFLVMHPALGLGVAAARTPNPIQARLKSLMAHIVFGIGLYLCALIVSPLLTAHG